MTYALLLNASGEPLQVLTARGALDLILRGKAVPVEDDAGLSTYHYERGAIRIPAVLRLLSYVKIPYRAAKKLTRVGVLARDGKLCQFTHCSRAGETIDHLVPRSRGGQHEWTNVVAACRPCNGKKGNRSMAELGWSLKAQPYAPKAWFFVVFRFESNPAWAQYLTA